MDRRIIMLFTGVIIALISTSLASAVIFDVAAARQEEWERYKDYKADYVQTNDLEAFSRYIDERGLQNSFGFKPASYYYIPPDVLQAKYNPPLQGVAYTTENRGLTSSLYQPSAVKYYGEQLNGRYTGFIPSTKGGIYFDHPQMNGGSNGNSYAYNPYSYGSSGNYGTYGGYSNYGYGNYGSYNYNSYSSSNADPNVQGYYDLYPYSQGSYMYYDSAYQNSNYNNFNSYGSYGSYYSNSYYSNSLDFESFEEPRYYSRMVEPLTGGYYIVGYY